MGKCSCHPQIETDDMCMKDNTYLCKECFRCPHPKDYCKFRSSCQIWFITKDQQEDKEENTEETT